MTEKKIRIKEAKLPMQKHFVIVKIIMRAII
jgi:hypothetical protein